MMTLPVLLIIIAAALVTFFTRAVPFLLFGGRKEVPELVQYLGRILPPAIIAALIVYCLKGVEWTSFPSGIPEILSVMVVAALHIWKKNMLLSIGAGTVFYMMLVQNVF